MCCCGGDVGCVSSLSSQGLMMWPLLVRSLMFFESLMDGIVRICPSEPFESRNVFVCMVYGER